MQRVQRIPGNSLPAPVRHHIFIVQGKVDILRGDKKRIQKLSHGLSSMAPRKYAETDLFRISFGRHSSFREQALQDFDGFTFGV